MTLQIVVFIGSLLLAYLVGSIPFGLVIGKLVAGVDVREHGSGNVGTTNVFRVLGAKAGVVVFVCDMLKGFLPTFFALLFFSPWYAIFIAAAPMLGHMYSVFLKGSGGKGVATGAGIVCAIAPLVFFISFGAWGIVFFVTRYVSLASLVGAAFVPVLTLAFDKPLPYKIAAVLAAGMVWWAHRGNIRRLLKGTEPRRASWFKSHRGGSSTITGSGGV